MRDPYLYDDVDVLCNLKDIRSSDELRRVEGEITRYSLALVYSYNFSKYNAETLCEIHRIIFDDLYEWAGEFRTISLIKHEEILGGDTVRYSHPKKIKKELNEASKEIAKLKRSESKKELLFKLVRITAKIWQIHPFREGNTRAVLSFIILLTAHLNIDLDSSLLEEHAAYVRNALVWASQGIYSKYEYLERIFYDAAGELFTGGETDVSIHKDYTHIEGYYVADYTEQPHFYTEESVSD